MAYKPRYTLFRRMAEQNEWQTRCGSEVSLVRRFFFSFTSSLVDLPSSPPQENAFGMFSPSLPFPCSALTNLFSRRASDALDGTRDTVGC
jgi:hypothetical protein